MFITRDCDVIRRLNTRHCDVTYVDLIHVTVTSYVDLIHVTVMSYVGLIYVTVTSHTSVHWMNDLLLNTIRRFANDAIHQRNKFVANER